MTDLVDGASAALRHLSPGNAWGRLTGTRLPLQQWTIRRRELWLLIVALLALILTAVLQLLSVAVHSLSGNTMVATAAGLIGVLAAFVFAERMRATHQLRDFLIALALGMLSATDLILVAGPALINANPSRGWEWITFTAWLIASAILVAGAFCADVDLGRSRRLPVAILVASASALAVLAALMLVWHSHLPGLLGGTSSPASAGQTRPPGHLLLSYLQISGTMLAACAAVGLARHSARNGDLLESWMAAGITVLAVARLNYFLVPSLTSGRLFAGDVLKLAAYLLILYGCLLEFRALQRGLVARVTVDERRRMARDMHDGLAQELAFITTHSQRLGQSGDDAATVVHLRAAAERALHDSRTTIAVLTSTGDAPLDALIARTAESFTTRFGVAVELDLQHDVVVDAERRNALLRILHEALTNAIRHGAAQQILVRLRGGRDGPWLSIADDGSGFDVASAVGDRKGLGLISMGERAELLGGGLTVVSTPGSGTVVEVGLP
jgi:signal transduction histidine kinase